MKKLAVRTAACALAGVMLFGNTGMTVEAANLSASFGAGMNIRLTEAYIANPDIDKDIKKKDLSAKAGISPATITKMGRGGHVTTEVLVKICSALECTMDDIIEIVHEGN